MSYLPGGHLPPPNSDIYHPQKPYICQEDNCHPQFLDALASLDFKLSLSGSVSEGCFSASASSGLLELFLLLFLGFFDLQLMEDIKDGKEEVQEFTTLFISYF